MVSTLWHGLRVEGGGVRGGVGNAVACMRYQQHGMQPVSIQHDISSP